MYAYLRGEDEHFVLGWFHNRKQAESWLASELSLYRICYQEEKAEYRVMSNKEFFSAFPEIHDNIHSMRKLGKKLKERIEEGKKINNKT